jgi:FtsZ-binding cell division protein ZapB
MKPKGFDSCVELKSRYEFYPVKVAAALWCGIPEGELNHILNQAIEVSRGVWASPYISCLEPRCRAIHDAINDALLPVCRENGHVVEEHVAPERRHVRGEDLRIWIAENFPNDKPAFLFDEIERSTHTAINSEAFRALQVDRDAIKLENEKLKKLNQELTRQKEELKLESESIKACIEKMTASSNLNPKAETTYLNIIGAMLELILGKSPAGMKHSIFDTQAAVISALMGYHSGKQGISDRNLEQKFSDAKKSLKSSM